MKVPIGLTTMLALTAAAMLSAQQKPDPHPDFQGLWTNGTATALQRPPEMADKARFTPDEAREYERTALDRLLAKMDKEDRLFASDVDETFLETQTLKVVGDLRTALIVDPPTGRIPPDCRRPKRARPPARNGTSTTSRRCTSTSGA